MKRKILTFSKLLGVGLLLMGIAPASAQITTWTPPGWSMLTGTAVGPAELVNIGGPSSFACTTMQLQSGDGQVSWYVPNPDQDFVVSIHGAGGGPLGEYALRVVPFHAEVREGSWQFMAGSDLRVGDSLSISIVGGRVFYLHNGNIFYASRNLFPPALYPAVACAQFMAFGGWISNLQVQGAWK